MDLKLFLVIYFSATINSLELRNGAYEDFVIKISETVPEHDCKNIVDNLEATLSSASQYLFSALDGRAFLRSATVMLPSSWHDNCVTSSVMSGSGETSDVTIQPTSGPRGTIWTQQSLGCGQPGDQIYLGYESLLKQDNMLGRSLIKEFAMYRYGVFEEQGYHNDNIYPMCYYDDQTKQKKVTGCSDLPIKDNGICSGDEGAVYNTTQMVDDKARSSIMFAAEAPSVSMFCDDGNHDKTAPTKHNLICDRRSVLEVIMKHSDFASLAGINNFNSNQITDTAPKIVYKRQNLTRYVFVIENTKDMMQRESWSYLRLALRYWAKYAVPDDSELGLVLNDHPKPTRALNIVSARVDSYNRYSNNRDKFYSLIPYTPSESMQSGCLHCSIKEAADMLNERNRLKGPAANVIVVIAPGMIHDNHMANVIKDIKKTKIRIATINYPDIVKPNTLRTLAEETGGVDYSVFEKKLNVESTLLSTYFELHNALQNIVQRFYSGPEHLPIEIHRREITDDGRSSVTGSFMLEPNMGEPAQFTFFTHNTVTPLIKGLKLISPSQQTFSIRNDLFIDFKMITLNANISETGTWTYIVEPYSGNPQPHFLQVSASPKSSQAPIVKARFWTHRSQPGGPLILLCEVKHGDLPILGAKVDVTVTKPDTNGSLPLKYKFELLDTGSGDPDITKGDGVYTRYFDAAEWGHGLYTFQVVVTDNGNIAYTWTSSNNNRVKNCCGSSISTDGVQPISPFQRVLPQITMRITGDEILSASQVSVGRIGDLKVQIISEDMKARLSWTSPDMAGHTVARYEIKYASNINDITDNFETNALVWDKNQPLPLAPGSETTFTLDMSQAIDLLDKPLYFSIKAYDKMSGDLSGPISNWVRVLVPSPPPPPTVPPTGSSNEASYWPNLISDGADPISPSVSRAANIGLELILPVTIGFILLVILLIIYCYFCVVKRRNNSGSKSNKAKKNNKLNSNITIVPSTPQNTCNASMAPSYTSAGDIPDPHTIGVPVNNYAYEDETKKRYSLVNQQEQQLIDELKQQQQIHHQQRDILSTPNTYGGVSVISNGSIQRNGHTLSPYNSWTASQLLHEHERRHSPMENMMNDDQQMLHQEMMNGSQADHMSVNGQVMDRMSISGHHIGDSYPQGHIPPPVPPLPAFNSNGYNYNIYGVHPNTQHQIYQTMPPRNDEMLPFNASLQGSMTSVNSGEKKRRNVTMV